MRLFLFAWMHLSGKQQKPQKIRVSLKRRYWLIFFSLSLLNINLVKNHLVYLWPFTKDKVFLQLCFLRIRIYGIMPIMWFKVFWETYCRNKYENYSFVDLANIYSKPTMSQDISWLWDSKEHDTCSSSTFV